MIKEEGKWCNDVKLSALVFSLVGRVRRAICALIFYRWAETLNTAARHTVSSSWWVMPTAFGITFYSQTLMWVLC